MASNVRLGKHDYKFDEKTLRLAAALSPTLIVPHKFDFDKGRSPFPIEMWGNDQWGDCVKVAQTNGLLRLERLEQRRTVHLTADDVVAAYQAQTGAQTPGDPSDTGLVMLDNLRVWRKEGYTLGNHCYKIAAFGELDPHDSTQLRAGVFLFHGTQFGFALPRAAQAMTEAGVWDYNGSTGTEWQPGSWGGHAVFSKAYDDEGFEVLTWGRKVKVTTRFIDRYCDEAWAVVDDFDSWRNRPEIDINSVIQHLHDIGATGIEQ